MDVIGEVLYWFLRIAAVWFGVKTIIFGMRFLREKWKEMDE